VRKGERGEERRGWEEGEQREYPRICKGGGKSYFIDFPHFSTSPTIHLSTTTKGLEGHDNKRTTNLLRKAPSV
jgi:hypothetical protein